MTTLEFTTISFNIIRDKYNMEYQKQQICEQPSIESALKLFLITLFLYFAKWFIPKGSSFIYCVCIVINIICFLFILIIAIKQNLDIKKTFRIKRINCKMAVLSIIIGIVTATITIYLSELIFVLLSFINIKPYNLFPFLKNTFEVIFYIIYMIMFAPLLEEFLFRGYILKAFEKFGFTQAIVFSSFLFALFHGTIMMLVIAGLIGLVLGYMLCRTNSIFSSILIHSSYNAVVVLFGYYFHLYEFDVYTRFHFYNFIIFPAILLVMFLPKMFKKQVPFKELDDMKITGFVENIKSLFKIGLFRFIIILFSILYGIQLVIIIISKKIL